MRTKTYIAADFDNDIDAVDILYYWKNNQSLSFDFQDAHDLTQARDTSLPCSIKSSLRYRLTESKTFILIVGEHTDSLTKGSCQFCSSYNSHNYHLTIIVLEIMKLITGVIFTMNVTWQN